MKISVSKYLECVQLSFERLSPRVVLVSDIQHIEIMPQMVNVLESVQNAIAQWTHLLTPTVTSDA